MIVICYNQKVYNVIPDYVDDLAPADTRLDEKPYISIHSLVIKGKDILMSNTIDRLFILFF